MGCIFRAFRCLSHLFVYDLMRFSNSEHTRRPSRVIGYA